MTSYQFEEEKTQFIESILTQIETALRKKDLCLEFAKAYLGTVAWDDLTSRSVDDWCGLVVNYWNFIYQRASGETKIRVYNPDYERDGWQSTHTVIEVVHDDIPFLVDSLHMEVDRMGFNSYLIIHSGGVQLKRDEDNKVIAVLPANAKQKEGFFAEADIFIEINRQIDAQVLKDIHKNFEHILKDVQSVNRDWSKMRQKVRDAVGEMDTITAFVDADELAESKDFLNWVEDHHFTFLGLRDYETVEINGEISLRALPHTGLGVLSEEKSSKPLTAMPPEAQKLLLSSQVLMISKTNTVSTVHRPVYTDYIGIKRFDKSGKVIGERRIIGLYTSAAYNMSPRQIPFLRRKVDLILEQSNLNPRAHTGKILLNILETLPRDDLFQAPAEELLAIAMGIYHMQERRRIRLFARKDVYGRFISCLVYMPKDRYDTALGSAMQEVISRSFHAKKVLFSTRFSDSSLAQLHFIARIDADQQIECTFDEVEKKLMDVCRVWSDDFNTLLLETYGEVQGTVYAHRYEKSFSVSYQDYFSPRTAVYDVKHVESLSSRREIQMSVYQPLNEKVGNVKFKLYRFNTTTPLSDVLPILERLGLRVISERPFKINLPEEKKVWINDFGMVCRKNIDWNSEEIRTIFQEAFENIWFKRAENDGFNQLVLSAQLNWREVSILRAYAKYFKQIHLPYSQDYIEEALVSHPGIAKKLVDLFLARFTLNEEIEDKRAHVKAIHQKILKALDAVDSLDQDKILRRYIDVVFATVRTNYFQRKKDGALKSYLTFKIQPDKIPEMPLPLPMYEIFIYSPRFEGVHLRCAKVARGGIRWSDRREDFRTEVLGLMKAQEVKNSVIVPRGAKGGFCPKKLPLNATRDVMLAEGVACYKRFIRAMLDITDNYQGDEVIRPINVVCYDDEDPYLVVAADKGTATFSDIANKISCDHNFWLGDAFASGGSAGYDHKKMGITARGAWESVKRHFHELGMDTQMTDFTVVGIGDMSGDVFGNGMLLSKHIRLVGAFNHMHIFIDPNPDAASSFEERERLFNLPRSAWTDYNRKLISKGGGIFNRNAKFIALSDEIKACFQLTQDTMEPNELIRAMLKSSVDLLWNGGIGTYVKSCSESHADVGDRSTDVLRVNGRDLRCRVVGEGGNLGCTQLGRIEYALRGGLIYTDFIDNSAGVDCSDNEVNIKILLNKVIANGDLTEKQRNELLVNMTDEVARLVLNDNYQQIQAISLAAFQGPRSLGLHGRYMQYLEEKGLLNRALEFLPDEKILAERGLHDKGLTRSELAILFAYTKNILTERILTSSVPDDPFLNQILIEAFPQPLRNTYAEAMEKHRLKREIIATKLSNFIVNKMGFTFIYRTEEETGASVDAIVKAFIMACHVFEMDKLWLDIQSLEGKIATADQLNMLMICVRWMRRVTRWFLRSRRMHDSIGAALDFYAPGIKALKKKIPVCLNEPERIRYEQSERKYEKMGISSKLSKQLSMIPILFSSLDIVEAMYELNADISDVSHVYFRVGTYLDLVWLRDQVIIHAAENHWESLSREVLRDDLDWQQRLLTVGILRHRPDNMDLSQCLMSWTESYVDLIKRWKSVVAELKASPTLNFTMFFMAIRELLDLTQMALLQNKSKLTSEEMC
jgi:glutamate dehydrogenase